MPMLIILRRVAMRFCRIVGCGAHLGTATISNDACSLSPRGTSAERVGEGLGRGAVHKRQRPPLFASLSPHVVSADYTFYSRNVWSTGLRLLRRRPLIVRISHLLL